MADSQSGGIICVGKPHLTSSPVLSREGLARCRVGLKLGGMRDTIKFESGIRDEILAGYVVFCR